MRSIRCSDSILEEVHHAQFKRLYAEFWLLLIGSLGLLMIANELASGQRGGVGANNICNNISYDYNCATGEYTYYKLSDCLSCVSKGAAKC